MGGCIRQGRAEGSEQGRGLAEAGQALTIIFLPPEVTLPQARSPVPGSVRAALGTGSPVSLRYCWVAMA